MGIGCTGGPHDDHYQFGPNKYNPANGNRHADRYPYTERTIHHIRNPTYEGTQRR
jgi:hypothetical protein